MASGSPQSSAHAFKLLSEVSSKFPPDIFRVVSLEVSRGNAILEIEPNGVKLRDPIDIPQLDVIGGLGLVLAGFKSENGSLSLGDKRIWWNTEARSSLTNPFAAGVAYMTNGGYVPLSEAKLSVTDFAFTRSDVT
ncbi:hypothetical protein HDU93_004376, partial [Gonapodya sp. JEL0774]